MSKTTRSKATAICQQCRLQFSFKPSSKMKFCSIGCRRAARDWSAEEDGFLIAHAGAYPPKQIASMLRRHNTTRGLPKRTDKAVDARFTILGLSRVRTMDSFSCRSLSQELGVSDRRVRNMIRDGLPYKRVAVHDYAISLRDLQRWALEHPERFSDLSEDALFWMMDGRQAWVDQIKSAPRLIPGVARPVRCINNSKLYPTMEAAAVDNFISRVTVARSVREGCAVAGGLRFELASDGD